MSTKKNNKPTEVQIPIALREIIDYNIQRIEDVRQAAMNVIQASAAELMILQGLSPDDGWRLDIDNRKYVRISTENTDSEDGST